MLPLAHDATADAEPTPEIDKYPALVELVARRISCCAVPDAALITNAEPLLGAAIVTLPAEPSVTAVVGVLPVCNTNVPVVSLVTLNAVVVVVLALIVLIR